MNIVDVLGDMDLARVLLTLMLLLSVAHVLGFIFQRLHMPRVIGEIAAGILLGPTLLGTASPEAFEWLFSAFPAQGKLMGFVSSLGLIFLMFISGFEVQRKLAAGDRKIVTSLSIFSTIMPFAAGLAAVYCWNFGPYAGVNSNPISLQIIIAVAVAITSIPVISKIFLDLGIMQTRFAGVVLTTATIHDVILWVALAVAAALAGGKAVTVTSAAAMIGVNVLFFAAGYLFFPRLVDALVKSRYNFLMRSSAMGFIIFACLFFVVVASVLSVNVIFGAFLSGIVIGRTSGDLFEKQKEHIKEISFGLFVPLYFAMVGLKLNLLRDFDPVFSIGFITFAMVAAIAASFLGGKIAGQDNLSSLNLAVAMNARGGPGIVLASLAYDLGIINGVFFTTLIILALFSSLLAGWWLKFILNRGWSLIGQS